MSASPQQQDRQDPPYEPDPRRWKALSVTLVVGFMTLLDVSIVSVALPSMQDALGTTASGVQWVVSGYALTFGLVLVPAGRLGDAFGRRRIFLVALVVFVLSSAAAGAAPSVLLLVVARLVQGVAAGFLAPQNSAFIQQLFRGPERGKAFGLFGATVGVSTAIGPVVGGLLIGLFGEDLGWRAIFFVNVPIGVVAFVLATRLLPKAEPAGTSTDIDVVGVLLLGVGATFVLLPLVQAESGGIARLWWLFLLGAVALAAFAVWERRVVARGREPVFDVRLLTETRGYASGVAVGTVYFIGFSGIWLVFALFFQTGLGWTPLQSGLAVVPFAIGAAGSAALAGRLVSRFGRLLTVIGLSVVSTGLAATAVVVWLVPTEILGWVVVPTLFLAGLGGGFVISPNITLTLRDVPVRMAGAAGGGLQTMQRFGAALGSAVLPGLFYVVLSGSGEYPVAAGVALGTAVLGALAALVIAVLDWRRDRPSLQQQEQQEQADRREDEHAHGHHVH
ncbi:MFS transporter [Modestobacter sp. Leaf380]|uniref:MFS transporter n=1 Tax=Modestobacter sp. Leaf380 TaxID=1736356 RepID=UPI000B1E1302|nr:MFS transporter [Modestobacter sp. Leaf380]